jgi:hypothetical protein
MAAPGTSLISGKGGPRRYVLAASFALVFGLLKDGALRRREAVAFRDP